MNATNLQEKKLPAKNSAGKILINSKTYKFNSMKKNTYKNNIKLVVKQILPYFFAKWQKSKPIACVNILL